MKPLYIFDLDGTLALIEHRRHLVEGEHKDWRAFFAACVDDEPNLPVIRTLQALRKAGAEVWVWSGRSSEVQAETEQWLFDHGVFKAVPLLTWNPFNPPEMFLMRKEGDYRDDVAVKSEWLANLEPPERNRLTAVFDDRDKVVAMWRAAGVPCFQVAPGDF